MNLKNIGLGLIIALIVFFNVVMISANISEASQPKYVDGTPKSYSSNSSSSKSGSSTTCKYSEGCSRKAMSGGSLCEYHFGYLQSIYDGLTQ